MLGEHDQNSGGSDELTMSASLKDGAEPSIRSDALPNRILDSVAAKFADPDMAAILEAIVTMEVPLRAILSRRGPIG